MQPFPAKPTDYFPFFFFFKEFSFAASKLSFADEIKIRKSFTFHSFLLWLFRCGRRKVGVGDESPAPGEVEQQNYR